MDRNTPSIINYDIGILTFWDVPNYGTFAQAYALERTMNKLFPNRDSKQIAYLNKKHYDSYYNKHIPKKFYEKGFVHKVSQILNPSSAYNLRKKNFPGYYQTIQHTDRMNESQLTEAKFNAVILGSDIIWDYSFDCFDRDPFLFGQGFNSDRIIAYACSFGTIKADSIIPDYVRNGLLAMNHISVREENSADIVERVTGTRPQVVLDPTWLWDFKTDRNVVKPVYEHYVVVYGQDFTKEYVEQLINYAKKRELQIICLDCNEDQYDWCDVLIRQAELSPFEWIGLFQWADVIATSTYHGLTFGLIFNKPVAFCATDFIISKAGSFLKDLGLYGLLSIKGQSIETLLNYDWDYNEINSVIERKRRESIEYLEKALK